MIYFALLLTISANGLEREVSRLGPMSDVHSIERIAKFGCPAVPYLARNLKATTVSKAKLQTISHTSAMKLVWTIAALRYISGEDFYSNKNPRKIGIAGAQMLSRGVSGQKIFGVWPSRELVFFNSVNTQNEIIGKWKLYAASGKCKTGRTNKDISFWLYGNKH